MNFRIICWNIRGLNNAGKRFNISNLLKNWKSDVVCFQETKMEWIFAELFGVYGVVLSWLEWFCQPFGALGGILLLWNKCTVEHIEEAVGTFSISCKFKSTLDQFIWAFSGVYGPNADSDRHYLWEELSRVFSWWEISWCIGGDFNVTHFLNGRVGASRLTSAMWELLDFISEQGLMDTPLVRGSFTWSNNQDLPLCPGL